MSRARSTSTRNARPPAREPALRCEACGTLYHDLGFQVVLPRRRQSFDRVECALTAARAAPAQPEPFLPLGRAESLAAELFTTRVGLDRERRLRQELERKYERLAAELYRERGRASERERASGDRAPTPGDDVNRGTG